MEKRTWRAALAQLYKINPPGEGRDQLDALLVCRLADWVRAQGARSVLTFAARADEPNLGVFHRRWLAGGGTLAFPVWQGGSKMIFRTVTNPAVDLRPGRGGTPEPHDGLPQADPAAFDLVIVPGMAFSEQCRRLGRGQGCYDVFLSACPHLKKCGIAYDYMVFPVVPSGRQDVPMDVIITPTRMIER